MIRKVGSEYCLFTHDGSRKLGCHPTEAEAVAQEQAIKAREAQASRLVSSMFQEPHRKEHVMAAAEQTIALGAGDVSDRDFLSSQFVTLGASDFMARYGTDGMEALAKGCSAFVPVMVEREVELYGGSTETDDAGNVYRDVPLMFVGTKWKNGGAEFNSTKKDLETAISNFEQRNFPIPVTKGHMKQQRQATEAVGWIEKMWVDGEKLMGRVKWLASTWAEILAEKWKGISLEFWTEAVDQKGKKIGMDIDGAALTNYPFFPLRIDTDNSRGQVLFALSRFTKVKEVEPVSETKKEEGKGIKIETAKEIMDKDANDVISIRAGDVQILQKALNDRDAKIEELSKKVEASGETVRRLEKVETTLKVRDLQYAARELLNKGIALQFGKYKVLDNDEDALAWLATTPMGVSTVEGFQTLAKDETARRHLPKINLGGERGGGSDSGEGYTFQPDLDTKAGRDEAVQRRVAAIKKTYGDEFSQYLSKGETVESFARKELATEHPNVNWKE